MKLTFLGGAEEVGRSCILLSSDRTKIMMDCGVKIELKKNEYPQLTQKELKDVKGIFISHAHLDHCCFLPHIFSMGYTGKVFCTKPTFELLQVQVADYMRLSNPPDVTKQGLERMVKSFKIIEYRAPFKFEDMTVEFLKAGHIVGSALIKITAKEKGRERTVIYTGDINLMQSKLLEGADLENLNADTLVTESTYGGKDDNHPNEKENARQMVASIKKTLLAGGNVLIPSFAVQRAQEVLVFLDDFMNSGQLPKVPIYVDGMINKVMRIHRHNVIYCKKEIQSKILMSDYDPFRSDNFVVVEEKSTRGKIIEEQGGSIIVTTSGMLTGGPVVYYLKRLAGDPANKMILIGYQAEGTPGRELQEGKKEVDFHDSKLRVRMTVEVFPMSAHADRKQLESIPKKIKNLRNIFIVHGEKHKAEALAEFYRQKRYNTIVPKLGEVHNF